MRVVARTGRRVWLAPDRNIGSLSFFQEWRFMRVQAGPVSKLQIWAGRALSGLVVLFFLFDGGIKVMRLAPAVEGTVRLGYPENLIVSIGIVALVCVTLYAVPHTSVMGAILLTGYLGGATATQVRVGASLFSVLFPVIFGVLIWAGLFLRDDRLRMLVPLRN
jgi:hypothetical protein